MHWWFCHYSPAKNVQIEKQRCVAEFPEDTPHIMGSVGKNVNIRLLS